MQRQERSTIVHATAVEIRKLLDEARKHYEATGGDWDDVESDVLDLVTAEEE